VLNLGVQPAQTNRVPTRAVCRHPVR
jgi:hypothetical protein